MEGHPPQRRPAHSARVLRHRGEAEAGARRLGDLLAGDGVKEVGELAGAFDPPVEGVVL